MKHTKFYSLVFLVTVLLILGCSGEVLSESKLGVEIETMTNGKGTIKYIPYKESGILSPTTNPDADLGVECGDSLFEIFNEKDGNASHLGKISGFENSCVNFATGEVLVTGVNIAANGDHLYFEANCGFISQEEFVCELTIMGGTGRFENASNPPDEPVIVEGSFNAATGVSVYNSHGKISSVGSRK